MMDGLDAVVLLELEVVMEVVEDGCVVMAGVVVLDCCYDYVYMMMILRGRRHDVPENNENSKDNLKN